MINLRFRGSIPHNLERLFGFSAITLVLLGGCSVSVEETKQLNTGKAEGVIRSFLQGKLGSPVDEVSCPPREAKQGDVFQCTARVEGQPVLLQVTQSDNEGNVDVVLVQAIIDLKQAVTLVEQQVGAAKGIPVQADCGNQRYLVKDPGSTFDCRATPKSGGASSRVVVTVKDVEGNVDLRLA